MGVAIKAAGAVFSKYVTSLTLPDLTGLRGEYFFGGSNASSIVNHANASAPMTVVGAPTHSAMFTTVSGGATLGSHGFDVNLQPTNDLTIIMLARKKTNFPALFATNTLPTGLLNYTNFPAFYNSQSGTLANAADTAVPAHSNFFMIAGTGALAQLGRLYVYASGAATVAVAESAGGASRPAVNFFIGTTVNNGGVGNIDIAYAALFERVLTATEMDAAYASLKAFFADRGLAVS